MKASTITCPDMHVQRVAGAPLMGERAAIVGLLCAYVSEALRSTEQWASAQGIHTTDARALAALAEAQRAGHAMTAGDLGATIGLSSPATSALIHRLESGGHVVRHRDPEDRRRVLLSPSLSAVVSAIAYFQPMGDAVTQALEGCGGEDTQVIAGFLERLVNSMRVMPSA